MHVDVHAEHAGEMLRHLRTKLPDYMYVLVCCLAAWRAIVFLLIKQHINVVLKGLSSRKPAPVSSLNQCEGCL